MPKKKKEKISVGEKSIACKKKKIRKTSTKIEFPKNAETPHREMTFPNNVRRKIQQRKRSSGKSKKQERLIMKRKKNDFET